MGTPEQKARRQKAIEDDQKIWDAAARGDWSDDNSLREFLMSIGLAPDKAKFNQYNSTGGYSTYGGSWDPAWKFDFNTGEKIPHMGEGETWYDPSVAENWQMTPELQRRRINQHYRWRDENGNMIDNNFGGNAFAAEQRLKSLSNMPNVGDTSWWYEGNRGVTPTTSTTPTSSAPSVTTPVPQPASSVNPAIYGSSSFAPNTGLLAPTTPFPTDPSNPHTRQLSKGPKPNAYGTNASSYGRFSAPSMSTPRRSSPAWYSTWKY